MRFRFETSYDWRGLTALNRALRQTVRKRRGRTVTFFSWVAAALGLLLLVRRTAAGEPWTARGTLSCAAVLILLAIPFAQDRIRGYFAWRNLPRDKARAVSAFGEKDWTFAAGGTVSRFSYGDILCSCEAKGYFVLLLEGEDGRLCDQTSLTGGSPEEFREFLRRKTGRPVIKL